jgi:SAM-dependent methyltransferase
LLLEGARRFHGDSMLWLGPVSLGHLDLDRCMVRQRIFGALAQGSARRSQATAYVGAMESLPFAAASLDAVVMHHALDCATDSRVAMSEVARALRPGGRLLICGFNPYSFWGIRPWWARLRRDAFTGTHFVSPIRVLDWLAVLGLEIDEPVHYLVYRPPLGAAKTDYRRLRWLRRQLGRWQIPFGGVYVILASKKATASIEAGATRRFSNQPALIPMPKPTARHSA